MSVADTILKVALPVPIDSLFDYRVPGDTASLPAPGTRVRVPFGRRSLVGLVVDHAIKSELAPGRLKAATDIIDEEPLFDVETLGFLIWAASYYHHPLGEVLAAAQPVSLRQGKPTEINTGERFWQLTTSGRAADPGELKRAPVQRKLMGYLLVQSAPVSADSLSELAEGWRGAINALEARGWVELTESLVTALDIRGRTVAPQLNPDQARSVQAISESLGRYGAFLLEGITGSGKTEVYLDLMNRVLDADGQVLMLVPEIGLTPQLVERLQQRLNHPVMSLHSAMTDRQRSNAWISARAGMPMVILGTRSAVFTPMPRLGLIIVDEEHDQSYKQHEGFRYHARDLAVMRAKRQNAAIVLGSATPSLESVHNVNTGIYTALELPARAGDAVLPQIELLDLKSLAINEGLTHPLRQAITQTLQRGEQSLLFLNRRGYAPVLMCHQCGWIQSCSRCDAHMILHRGKGQLRCHHCGHQQPVPVSCPACQAKPLKPVGEGTERIEDVLAQQFPGARIERVDRDTTARKGELERKLQAIQNREVDIIVGTQMLAKGHDFPAITLVGVLNADQGLYGADFRAPEHLIQQLMQVSGRSGRADKPGKVFIQTHHPEHPLFAALLAHSYRQFADGALNERRQAGFPPFTKLALFRAEATQPGAAIGFLQQARNLGIKLRQDDAVQIIEPLPAPMEKRAGRYRAQLLVQSDERAALHRLLSAWLPQIAAMPASRKVRWSVDVDPVDML